jgi:hypothetical protein
VISSTPVNTPLERLVVTFPWLILSGQTEEDMGGAVTRVGKSYRVFSGIVSLARLDIEAGECISNLVEED